MVILGYVLALLVGLSLGLLGGGGSILTVPILNYVMGMDAQEAIASSLVVVALTSLVGLIPHWRLKRVSFTVGLPFGLASMAGAFVGGWSAQFLPGYVLMILFAMIMLSTSSTMIRGKKKTEQQTPTPKLWVSALLGVVVGAVTGLVGAGGGFLIVPALVLFGGLPIHLAIGTSLFAIVMKNIAALGGHILAVTINWPVTLTFTAIAILGSLFGARLVSRISPDGLQKGFGWFVFVMGLVVIGTEVSTLMSP